MFRTENACLSQDSSRVSLYSSFAFLSPRRLFVSWAEPPRTRAFSRASPRFTYHPCTVGAERAARGLGGSATPRRGCQQQMEGIGWRAAGRRKVAAAGPVEGGAPPRCNVGKCRPPLQEKGLYPARHATCAPPPPASASRWRKMTTSRRPWQTQGLVLHKGQLERSHSLAGRASQTWKQTVRCGCTSKVRADRRSITVFPSIGSCLARNQAPSAAACYLWSVSLTVLVEAATVATAVVAADPARLSAYRHPRRPNPPSAASISS